MSWIGFHNAADTAGRRDEAVRCFTEQYRLMLEENLDDYIKNFEKYVNISSKGG